jgi:hypothetical protein
MKLLLENWRRFCSSVPRFVLTEERSEFPTMTPIEGPGRQTPKAVAKQWMRDASEGLKPFGYYPIRQLGEGQYGKVFLIKDFRTETPIAVKIVSKLSDKWGRERDNYAFAMENKVSMDPKFAGYLPVVYDIKEDKHAVYVMMELLIAPPAQIINQLLARDNSYDTDPDKEKRIFSSESAINDLIDMALNKMPESPKLTMSQTGFKDEHLEEIQSNALSRFLKGADITAEEKNQLSFIDFASMGDPKSERMRLHRIMGAEIYRVTKIVSPYPAEVMSRSIISMLEDSIHQAIYKQIVPVHQANSARNATTSGASAGMLDAFPEAEGIMAAMKYFDKRHHFEPKDVHFKNVMMRPKDGHLVIVDLGLFVIKR